MESLKVKWVLNKLHTHHSVRAGFDPSANVNKVEKRLQTVTLLFSKEDGQRVNSVKDMYIHNNYLQLVCPEKSTAVAAATRRTASCS